MKKKFVLAYRQSPCKIAVPRVPHVQESTPLSLYGDDLNDGFFPTPTAEVLYGKLRHARRHVSPFTLVATI
jgi:hypothetical protein